VGVLELISELTSNKYLLFLLQLFTVRSVCEKTILVHHSIIKKPVLLKTGYHCYITSVIYASVSTEVTYIQL